MQTQILAFCYLGLAHNELCWEFVTSFNTAYFGHFPRYHNRYYELSCFLLFVLELQMLNTDEQVISSTIFNENFQNFR